MLVDAPARQNASAMHTKTCRDRIQVVAGLNRSLVLGRFSSRDSKRVEGARFPIWRGFRPALRRFGSLEARMPASAIAAVIKIIIIQWLFKFPLS
jgi:hypothetical protein